MNDNLEVRLRESATIALADGLDEVGALLEEAADAVSVMDDVLSLAGSLAADYRRERSKNRTSAK